MDKEKIVGFIEIGTAKVTVLAAEIVKNKTANIIAHSHTNNNGMRKSEIVDISRVTDSVHAALLDAENQAGVSIEQVVLALSGSHVRGFQYSGSTPITGNGGLVMQRDVDRALVRAKDIKLHPDEVFVQHVKGDFLLDGRPVDNPVSRQGMLLEAQYWHVAANTKVLSDHMKVINGFGLQVEDVIISALASGGLLASEAEKTHGVLVMDIGAGMTDYALYHGGRIRSTGAIPIGGDHITNDLSLGLRMRQKHAESLKVRYAKAMVVDEEKSDTVFLVGDLSIGDRRVSQHTIDKITQSRLEELFSIVKKEVAGICKQYPPKNILLTGGVSRTPRICELAEHIFGFSATIAEHPNWILDDVLKGPDASTALGLLCMFCHTQV